MKVLASFLKQAIKEMYRQNHDFGCGATQIQLLVFTWKQKISPVVIL
jgi:hypothetical protein